METNNKAFFTNYTIYDLWKEWIIIILIIIHQEYKFANDIFLSSRLFVTSAWNNIKALTRSLTADEYRNGLELQGIFDRENSLVFSVLSVDWDCGSDILYE